MKRLRILAPVAVLAAAEVYRRGFAAPVAFGLQCWGRAWHCLAAEPLPTTEQD